MTSPPISLLHRLLLLTFFSLLLSSCSPTTPTIAPEPIIIQYSIAAQPWLPGVFDCAGMTPISAEQRAVRYFDSSADLTIRLGEPKPLTTPAFEIGTEDILVVVHLQNPVTKLDAMDVRGLFSGRIRNWNQVGGPDASVKAWIYASGEDVQQIFEASVMLGEAVTLLARLAASPEEMAQAVASDANAVGILPRRWKAKNTQEVYAIAPVPVLAITPAEPQGTLAELLACMQK
jgi:hypothetical protein